MHKMEEMNKNKDRSPMRRMLDGLDVLKQYGLDIPVEIIDSSEDGTETARKCLDIHDEILDMKGKIVNLRMDRLESYLEASGQPELTLTQRNAAELYFGSQWSLMCSEGAIGLMQLNSKYSPDLIADLGNALFGGMGYAESEE